jgi:hypothetical protein
MPIVVCHSTSLCVLPSANICIYQGDTGCDESDHKRRKMIEGRTAIRSPQSALMSWMKPQGVSTRRTG